MRALILILSLWTTGAFADRVTHGAYLHRVRAVQDQAERAYVRSAVMTDRLLTDILTTLDEATGLMRDVAAHPRLTENERGELYEQLLRGDDARDDDPRGSVARLLWSTITHHGADDVNHFGEDRGAFRVFRQTLYEAFLDVKSLVTVRRDDEGVKHWAARERWVRERAARAATVRLADALHVMDDHETRGQKAFARVYDSVHMVAETAAELRRERVAASTLAAVYFGAMIATNAFFAPMILPLVQLNYVGWVTGFAWGSAGVTGALNALTYVAAGLTNILGRTTKTYRLLRDLERMGGDPGDGEDQKARYQAFRVKVREGRSSLGRHRRRMMKRGYDPADPRAMTCAQRLASAIL